MEPEQLRRGKKFHRQVQAAWSGKVECAEVGIERTITLNSGLTAGRRRCQGRIDIFIDEIADFVTVVEIKGTNWDAVNPANRQKLLGVHRRQVLKYVDKYLVNDGRNVCAGVIYPRAPRCPGVKADVESYLNDHAIQVVWFFDD